MMDLEDDSDDMELVGLRRQPEPSRGRRRKSSRRSKTGRANAATGDYQVVANDGGLTTEDEHEDEYAPGEEDEGLISQITGGDQSVNSYEFLEYGFLSADSAIDWRCAFWLVISLLVLTVLALFLPRFNNYGKPIEETDGTGETILVFPNGTKTHIGLKNRSNFVNYQCAPLGSIEDAENYHNTSVEESYINHTSQIESNFSGFLQTFHQSEFDGWGKTYDFVKAGMYHWKSTRFPKNLKDGDTIYESACGIGLNLIMTLEILQEVKGVNNLIVYGNEYIESSANTSNKLLGALLPQLNATKGSICPADSTDLSFIPSHSFDLVFTGYISTLLDPLDIKRGVQENYQYYEKICKGESWEDKKLKEVAQQRQNDWFGIWVAEMIRIAKPGAPVIVEQVSYPFCEAFFDWGGVSQDFWTDYAIEQYNWEVDKASIEFEDDRLFRKRYHVFMRKQALNATRTPPPIIDEGQGGG